MWAFSAAKGLSKSGKMDPHEWCWSTWVGKGQSNQTGSPLHQFLTHVITEPPAQFLISSELCLKDGVPEGCARDSAQMQMTVAGRFPAKAESDQRFSNVYSNVLKH